MFNYDYPPFRPPNEANSALIRATRGCPWNKCQFCTMYKDTKFQLKTVDEIKKDVDFACKIYNGAKTVFIADSDSLVLKDIIKVISYIKQKFPDADRITSYARAKTLKNLGESYLKKIKDAGLTRVHIGLESGDKETLDFLKKGSTPEEMIAGGKAAKKAGLEVSFYVLIGAGGKKNIKQHAVESARVCNEVDVDFIRLRTLIVEHGSLLELQMKKGLYTPTSPVEKINEVKTFLKHLHLSDCEFASDHFTNYIFIDKEIIYKGIFGHLPEEKQKMLDVLDKTLDMIDSSTGEVIDATILYKRGLISSL